MTADDLRLMPWSESPGADEYGGGWSGGGFVSLDRTEVGPVSKSDVAEIIHYYQSPDNWDGNEIAVMQLKDGRFVAYETWWGPTGNGFSEDAYGGDSNLYFASSLDTILRLALGDEARRTLGIELEAST